MQPTGKSGGGEAVTSPATDAANTVVTQRGSTDINPKKFGRQSVRPSQERAVGEPSSGDEGGAGDKARSELRERRRRKTMELMSQTGLNLRDLILDKSNISSPVEAMRTIMTRGKEKGWTVPKLFGVFLEAGSTEDKIGWEKFRSGLQMLGLECAEVDERAIFESFDTNNSGAIELSEFTHWCLDIPTVAWRAERVRRTLNGNGDSVEHAAAVMADEALQGQLKTEPVLTGAAKPRYPLGCLIYEGSKLFWRSGETLRIAMHENKELHCVTISTMLESATYPFPELRVDSRLIPANCKDAMVKRAVELTESEPVAKGGVHDLTEDVQIKLFDKVRASVLSEYLLARLKLTEGPTEGSVSTVEGNIPSAADAAALAAAKLGQTGVRDDGAGGRGGGSALEITKESGQDRDTAAPSSVAKFGSTIPSARSTPVLMKLPGDADVAGAVQDDNGSLAILLLKDPPDFREYYTFSKRVTHEEFEHAVQRVSADMAEGRTVIETADNAQKKTRTSLANHNLTAHNAASEAAKATSRLFSSSSSDPQISGERHSASNHVVGAARRASRSSGTTGVVLANSGAGAPATTRGSFRSSSSTILPPAEGAAKRSSPSATQSVAATTRSSEARHATAKEVPPPSSGSTTVAAAASNNNNSGATTSSKRSSGSSSVKERKSASSSTEHTARCKPKRDSDGSEADVSSKHIERKSRESADANGGTTNPSRTSASSAGGAPTAAKSKRQISC